MSLSCTLASEKLKETRSSLDAEHLLTLLKCSPSSLLYLLYIFLIYSVPLMQNLNVALHKQDHRSQKHAGCMEQQNYWKNKEFSHNIGLWFQAISWISQYDMHSEQFQSPGWFKGIRNKIFFQGFCWCLHRFKRSECQMGRFSLGNTKKWQLSSPTAKPRGNGEKRRGENVSSFPRFQGTEKIYLMRICVVSPSRKKAFTFCCQLPVRISQEEEKWTGKYRQSPRTTL